MDCDRAGEGCSKGCSENRGVDTELLEPCMGASRIGFHEAKLDTEDVRARLPYIEKIVIETKKIISAK